MNNLYMKKIVGNVPMINEDYEQIRDFYKTKYSKIHAVQTMYPQALQGFYDYNGKHVIAVVLCPNNGTLVSAAAGHYTTVFFYSFNTFDYIGYNVFAGTGNNQQKVAIQLMTVPNCSTQQLCFVGMDKDRTLRRWRIPREKLYNSDFNDPITVESASDFYANSDVAARYPSGLHCQDQTNYFNGNYFIMGREGAKRGSEYNRTIDEYDLNLNYKTSYAIDSYDIALLTSYYELSCDPYTGAVPKMQAIDVGQDGINIFYGGSTNTRGIKQSSVPGGLWPQSNYGVRTISFDGTTTKSNIVDGKKYIDLLNKKALNIAWMENEGGFSEKNKMYSLNVIYTKDNEFRLLIIEEFSDAADAIDFSWAAAPYKGIRSCLQEGREYPRYTAGNSVHKFKNVVTGEDITDIFDFIVIMRRLKLNKLRVNLSGSGLKKIGGKEILQSDMAYIEITGTLTGNNESANSVVIDAYPTSEGSAKQLMGLKMMALFSNDRISPKMKKCIVYTPTYKSKTTAY